MTSVGIPKKHCIPVKPDRDITLQKKRSRKICSLCYMDGSAFRAGTDSRLKKCCIIADSVALCADAANVYTAKLLLCTEGYFLTEFLTADLQHIICIRCQSVYCIYIPIGLLNLIAVQVITARLIHTVRAVIIKFNGYTPVKQACNQ